MQTLKCNVQKLLSELNCHNINHKVGNTIAKPGMFHLPKHEWLMSRLIGIFETIAITT